MDDFWTAIMALPTGIYTVFVGLALLYWLFFMFGASDLDFLGGADGALEGGVDGALDGALDGAVDAAVDGAVDAAVDGAVEGAGDGAFEGGLGGILALLKLRAVPVTISLSFIAFFGWITSYFLSAWLTPLLPSGLMAVIVFIGAGVVGIIGTSFAIRPFGRLFVEHHAKDYQGLVGSIVVITTGRVDERFGQAQIMTSESFLLNVRAKASLQLKRGDQAMIVDYDPETRAFQIEPADPVLLGIESLSRH